jgi:glycosyltransferase involved in cell wall biosynthesis
MPKVSVVMPVYNTGPYIDEALAAMRAQTLGDFELIVINDGSTDDTAERVERAGDPRIRLVRTEHAGLVAAENLGLELAEGEYISRCDGDDIALPRLLERQADVLDRHPRTAAVSVWVRRFGGSQYATRIPTDPVTLRRLLRRKSILQMPVMYRRDAAREVGGYRGVVWEDWDLWIRLAARWDVETVPEYLALMRTRADSLYWSNRRAEKNRANLAMQLTAVRLLGPDVPTLITIARNVARAPLLAAADRLKPPRRPTHGENARPTVTVAVTSSGRPVQLARCLAAIEDQIPKPDEIVVAFDADDRDTAAMLESWAAEHPEHRRAIAAHGRGIVAGLQSATDAAAGEVVAFVDDDAVPREGWLAELLRGYLDPTVGGVGGRFVDHVDGRELGGDTTRVGAITWYGRVIGRHDRETDYCGDVELLPGTNMSFRRELIEHDGRLLHTRHGLALANELDTCLTIRRAGHRLVYTPWAVVDHYTTSYRDPVLGSRVAGDDVFTSAANYTYALLKYLPPLRRIAFLAYAFVAGSAMTPGPLRALAEVPVDRRRAREMARRIAPSWRGRASGIRMYRRRMSERA